MTRDDIIRMARKAGYTGFNDLWLHEFAALAYAAGAADEREACARVCEMTYEGAFEGARPCFETPDQCAAAIRARGQA